MTRSRWILVVVLALSLAAAWWWQRRDAEPERPWRTAPIERGALQAVVSASGTVTPVSQVQVGSQVSGQIRELFADYNSEVRKDQLIARLDPESFEYRLRQASADVEAARASVLTAQATVQSALAQVSRAQVELDEARRDLQRKQGLVAQNFISPAEADSARSRVATLAEGVKAVQAQVEVARAQARNAEAVVRQREAQQAQARVDLQRTQIRSPVDGIVIKRSVEVGQTVAASLQAPELFVIARNLDDMQVDAAVDEADISRVRIGQKVDFTIDAFPGRHFDGTVKQVRKAATSAQNVVTYIAVVSFANPGRALLPGMTANVRIVTDLRDAVLKVPNAALRVRLPGVEPKTREHAAAAANGVAAIGNGGPMAAMRERLVAELALSPEQTARVEAIFAAARPRFGELRTLADDERPRARERILAEVRAQVGEQLDDAQRLRYAALIAEQQGRQATRGRLYTLKDGEPVAHEVRLGISDGAFTELIVPPASPAAGVLTEGTEVITAAAPSSGRPRQSAAPRLSF